MKRKNMGKINIIKEKEIKLKKKVRNFRSWERNKTNKRRKKELKNNEEKK